MQGKIITVSRQYGNGGHSIGSELAKRMGVPFYDKEIIEMSAKESGFHQGFIEEKECVSSRGNKCNDWQGGMMSPEASFFVGKEQGGQEEMHNSEG